MLETLEPLSGERKCFRMINGVLVERTVQEVVPALKTNSEGLKKVLDDLLKQYKSKQDEMNKWKVCLETGKLVQAHTTCCFDQGLARLLMRHVTAEKEQHPGRAAIEWFNNQDCSTGPPHAMPMKDGRPLRNSWDTHCFPGRCAEVLTKAIHFPIHISKSYEKRTSEDSPTSCQN